VREGIEAIVFRTVGDQVSLWEAALPAELLKLPDELARVDGLLDDPVFFAPFVSFFDPRMGRPSTPMETYLRLMLLKFRYRLGYESLCREVSDSITWRRFCRIPLDGSVPHPTTLMMLTTRCGSAAVGGLKEALLAKAAEAKLLGTHRIRADTTVVSANVAYPTTARGFDGYRDRIGIAVTGIGEHPDQHREPLDVVADTPLGHQPAIRVHQRHVVMSFGPIDSTCHRGLFGHYHLHARSAFDMGRRP
jgi:IS5 family transposase